MSQTLSIPFNRLPLGFRFHPTDQELINHYLKRKISGQIKPLDAAVIPEIDVCRFEPWDLPSKSVIRSDDAEWFFFAPVDRKYPLGNRSNRATAAGYWKATGKDRFIRSRTRGGEVVVGMKKTLVFHKGRAPRGKRSCWIMHEYRTVEPEFEEGGFVLCRLFKKPEETVPVEIPPELEETGFSLTPANSSPSNALRMEDVFEGEFSTPLHQKSPEYNMLEDLQSLPDTSNNRLTDIPANSCPTNALRVEDVFEGEFATPLNQKSPASCMLEELQSLLDPNNNQLTESKLAEKACYLIPCPMKKPEESHSNCNTAADKGGQETENAVGEDTALYDELLPFLGPEYEHLLSDEFPQINALNADPDGDLYSQIHHPKREQDSVLDLFGSFLGTLEGSTGLSVNETGSIAEVACKELQMATMDEDGSTSSDVDAEVLSAKGGLGLCGDTFDIYGTQRSLEEDGWISARRSARRRRFTSIIRPRESGTVPGHYTKHPRGLVGQTSSMGTGISISHRNFVNLGGLVDSVGQQGIAERRIRLQSEAGNRTRSQTTEQSEVSEPASVVEQDRFSAAGDETLAQHIVCALWEVEGYEEPSSRSRATENNDADDAMEKPTLHQETSRVGRIPVGRIGVAVLVVASLICAGAVWFFNS